MIQHVLLLMCEYARDKQFGYQNSQYVFEPDFEDIVNYFALFFAMGIVSINCRGK